MVNIRPFRNTDFEMICSWWEFYGAVPPIAGMMCEDGTFILELGTEPVMTLSVLLTQSKEISYFEGYCAKPGLSKENSNDCGNILWDHCYKYLRDKGYKRVIIFTDKDSLARRYMDLGMTKAVGGLTSLAREL